MVVIPLSGITLRSFTGNLSVALQVALVTGYGFWTYVLEWQGIYAIPDPTYFQTVPTVDVTVRVTGPPLPSSTRTWNSGTRQTPSTRASRSPWESMSDCPFRKSTTSSWHGFVIRSRHGRDFSRCTSRLRGPWAFPQAPPAPSRTGSKLDSQTGPGVRLGRAEPSEPPRPLASSPM